MSKKILILVDSSTTMSQELAKEMEVEILPLSLLRNDGKEYVQEILTMTNEELLSMSDKGYTFKTSCTPVGILEMVIEEKLKIYDAIIALPICKKWSSQYNHLLTLEKKFNNKLFVVDTNEYGYAVEQLAIDLRNKINEDIYSINELIEYANNYCNKTICFFLCKDLDGLVASGRVPKIIGKLLKLAKIMPLIKVEGENNFETAVRNHQEIMNKMFKAIFKTYNNKLSDKDIDSIALLHTDMDEQQQKLIINNIAKTFNISHEKICVRYAPTIFTNIVRRGAIGLHVIANKNKN